MKIIGLIAKNIKNLKAVEILPTDNAVELRGRNGAGKSAIIDAIFSALTGTRLKEAIRKGEDRADVIVDMGDFVVKKRWTEKGEAVQVYSKTEDGKKQVYSSPQAFLDEKIGKLSFDPLAFKGMRPTERVELLKGIVSLNFDNINTEQKKIYDERTLVNSKIKDAIAQLKNVEAPAPETPEEEVSFKDELQKIQELREKRQVFISVKQNKNEIIAKVKAANEWVDDKEEEIKRLQEAINATKNSIKENEKEMEALILPPEITQEEIIAAESSLEEIEAKNVTIKAANRYRGNIKQGEKYKKEADALTEKIRRLDQDKHTRIANAKFPIEGLSMSDDSVLYEGIPFERLSTGQQIRVSTAIGMALNPELRVIFIREGALLDKANLKEIEAQAKEKDFQIWVEICSEDKEVGFFIEDGEVK